MSNLTVRGNVSGTGTVILESPNTNTNRTLTLPDATGSISMSVLGTVQASTSGTSIDFTGIPSWATRIKVFLVGVSTSGTSLPVVRIGDSGGIEATGYAGSGTHSNGSGFTGVSNATTNGFTLCGLWSAGDFMYAVLTLSRYNANSTDWVSSHSGGLPGALSNPAFIGGGGQKSLSDVLDRIRITTVNGTDTFDSGSINIMYEG